MASAFRAEPVRLKHVVALRVVAGLVPATSIAIALCLKAQGRQDKPGDHTDMWFKAIENWLYIPRYRCWTSGADASSRDVPVQVMRPRSIM